ncbi:MAG: elongation factor EF-2 [Halobacteria archaeon]
MTLKKRIAEAAQEAMSRPERIRNMGIIAHIDHGKTTFSDTLVAGAGLMSEELAGQQLYTDYYELEQQRGITINAANVSMVHQHDGQEYLINLIDTPGHVDFGGDVTRAMRAVDGAIVLVDAVEGPMPQTETVLRQALRENVRPVLFINKIDRLIKELKLDREAMKVRLGTVIDKVNSIIRSINPAKYEAGWRMRPEEGTVAFGSALHKFAISVPMMKKTGIGFNELSEHLQKGAIKELAQKSPLHTVILDMVVNHLPNPLQAQKERIPVIWKGDAESAVAKSMAACDPKGPLAFMVTDITVDPHAGEIATGRLFSGALKRGLEVYVSGYGKPVKIQQVGIYIGPDRLEVEEIPSGNIASVTGLREAVAGSTVSAPEPMPPFESIRYTSEPVVTKAVEAKDPRNLPKLIEALRAVQKEDPTVRVQIDEETGEHLIAGMGELHLEIIEYKISHDKGVPIETSPPIVVYREAVRGVSPEAFEGVSPNRHNRFYFIAEPLPEKVVELIRNGAVTTDQQELERRKLLMEAGMDKDEARNIVEIYEGNIFLNMTKGVLQMREVEELLLDGFHDAMNNGPLAKERCSGVKVKLMDIKLHEDAVHRGPAQVIPAVRNAVRGAIMTASPTLLEPMQNVFIQSPQDLLGNVTKEISARRGQILDVAMEGDSAIVRAKAPVAELFGFAGDIRGATEGRALWSTEHAGFEEVPQGLQPEVLRKIRERKGLKLEDPRPSDFAA